MGLIPAWAGKTTSKTMDCPSPRAHPRVGGENRRISGHPDDGAGSSPRGRGKHDHRVRREAEQGLIPAWAGKTDLGEVAHECRRAHPRVGGENYATRRNPANPTGSSPRGRGKPGGLELQKRQAGLIPAWAGKTSFAGPFNGKDGAHPRVGGENRVFIVRSFHAWGSSPRGRGKRIGHCWPDSGVGLIPAWAGKTKPSPPPHPGERAHPRVGGENTTSRRGPP